MLKKNKYWIASYSAHADILQRIVGENGNIEKLCVDCGGLRAPRGAKYRQGLLKNLVLPSRTLHAKILLKESDCKKYEIWLWTGNMRKATFESQNILLSFPIQKSIDKLKKWFAEPKDNLIFKTDGEYITDFFMQTESNLWSELENSIKKYVGENLYDCNLYAISPWGSAAFVNSVIELGFNEINLYSRYEDDCIPMWIDSFCSNRATKGWTANKSGIFPHMKCMFITKIDKNGQETLVWTYIGSANFTKKAMFDKGKNSNIEHALLFEEKKDNRCLNELFKSLTYCYSDSKEKGWMKRTLKTSLFKDGKYDESEDSLADERDVYENIENNERRKFCQEMLPILSQKSVQKRLDAFYKIKHKKPNEWYKLSWYKKIYEIKINSIDDCYHVMARISKESPIYDMDVPRIIEDDVPLNVTDAENLLNGLLVYANLNTNANERKKENPNDIEFKQNISSLNVRFLAKNFFDNKGNLKKRNVENVYNSLKKIDAISEKLDESYRIMYNVWWNMIKTLKGEGNE